MADLSALAAFASRLNEPGASFGKMTATIDPESDGDAVAWPYWQPSPLAEEFIEVAYDAGWIRGNVDWPKWMGTDEAKAFFENPATIATATIEQLQLLLTTVIRSDHFCEGAILQAFQDGIVLAAAERAKRLLSSEV